MVLGHSLWKGDDNNDDDVNGFHYKHCQRHNCPTDPASSLCVISVTELWVFFLRIDTKMMTLFQISSAYVWLGRGSQMLPTTTASYLILIRGNQKIVKGGVESNILLQSHPIHPLVAFVFVSFMTNIKVKHMKNTAGKSAIHPPTYSTTVLHPFISHHSCVSGPPTCEDYFCNQVMTFISMIMICFTSVKIIE